MLNDNHNSVVGLLRARIEHVMYNNRGQEKSALDWLIDAGRSIHQALGDFNFFIYRDTLTLTKKDLRDTILDKTYCHGKHTFVVLIFREGTIKSNKSFQNLDECYYGPERVVLTQDTRPTLLARLLFCESPSWTLRFTNRQDFDLDEVMERAFQLMAQKTNLLELMEIAKSLPMPRIIEELEAQAAKYGIDEETEREDSQVLNSHDGSASRSIFIG